MRNYWQIYILRYIKENNLEKVSNFTEDSLFFYTWLATLVNIFKKLIVIVDFLEEFTLNSRFTVTKELIFVILHAD